MKMPAGISGIRGLCPVVFSKRRIKLCCKELKKKNGKRKQIKCLLLNLWSQPNRWFGGNMEAMATPYCSIPWRLWRQGKRKTLVTLYDEIDEVLKEYKLMRRQDRTLAGKA